MKVKNYISSEFRGSEKQIDVFNPATGQKIAEMACATPQDVQRALESAQAAASVYGSFSINQRKALVEQLIEKLKAEESSLVSLLIRETGKTEGIARYDFGMLVDCLGYYIEEVKRNYGETIPCYDRAHFNFLSHQPVGVVAGILTWNFPLLNLGYKLGPVLATGCTCVLKISEYTPLATMRVAEIIQEIGFPPGTVNPLCGEAKEVSDIFAQSPIPRLLTMIGSTFAGKKLVEQSASTIKRFSLELGGDAPVLVFEDADLDAAVADVVGLKLANAGQICVAPNRVYVHSSLYEQYIAKAKQIMESYRFLGDTGSGPELSPVVSAASLDRMARLCDPAFHGGTIVTGGKRAKREGYFMEPTLIRDLPTKSRLLDDEIFGPILPILSFDNEEEIYEVANDTPYGLSAYLYTKSLARTLKAEQQLKFGNILVNEAHYSIQLPHGGLKQSGFGKDVSRHALADYYDIKRISIKR